MDQHNLRPSVRGSRIAILAALSAVTIGSSVVQANSPKRGWAGGNERDIHGTNSSWYYNWWTNINPAVTTAEYVPIMQNRWAVGAATQYNDNPNVKVVLGFNEPERPDQANLTVNEALDLWGQTQTSNKRLVSPAPSDTGEGRAWLQSFMSGANSRGYRVDAVAFHWYGDTRGGANSASGFLSAVDWYWNTFRKPVWITEFGGIDWSGQNPISQSTNRAFLEAAAAGLESRSYVERYSWYQWDSACRLINDDGTLTTIGEYYTGNTVVDAGQTMDLNGKGNTGNDTWYLRGGTITNLGTATTGFMRRILVTKKNAGDSGVSTITGSNNWTIKDYYLRIDAGNTLNKTGTNTIDFQALKFDNNGTLNINGGAVRLRGSVTPAGSGGTILVNAGGALALSSASQATANTLGLNVQLRGGTLRADDFRQTLSGSLAINADSTIETVGDLNLSATLTGSGKITKTGSGMLRVSNFLGSPARVGVIDVNAGTLMLEGVNVNNSVVGSSTINVAQPARLAGRGLISGDVSVAGELNPGLADNGPATLKFNGSLSLGPIAATYIDVTSTSNDVLNVASPLATTTVDGSLILRTTLGYDPAYLTSFNIVTTANGVTGRFDRVSGLNLVDTNKALAVTYTDSAVAVTVARVGDANVDGVVGFDDLLELAKRYGTTSGNTWSNGDFDGNGNITFSDMLLLAKQFGQSDVTPAAFSAELSAGFASDWALAQSIVPEPTTLGLLAAALPIVGRRRRA